MPSFADASLRSEDDKAMLTTANPFASKIILEGIRRWVEIATPTARLLHRLYQALR
jgi:hypothetical protein